MTDRIDLEVLTRQPAQERRPTPLLFVHSAYSSARQWEAFFLPFFAGHGWAAHAVSLRGHGASGGRETVRSARLRDYVADVVRVIETLPAPPVLIGHSMGGMIVQKVLVERAVPGAVLMCSVPPHGLLVSTLSAMFGNPLMFWQMSALQQLGPEAATLDGARRALFLKDTPDDWIRRVLPSAEQESDAVMLDMTFRDLPPSRGRCDVPMLVLGAGRDACITRTAVTETAHAFGVTADIFEDLPHALMMVPEWERPARRILEWLEALPAERSAAT